MNATQNLRSDSAGARVVPRGLLLALSFWGGFQIMVLEICGFRVLQTHLGSSVIVTGTLLTIVMVLLSAGYYVGGRLSSRLRGIRSLFFLLLCSAIYTVLVTAWLSDPITSLAMALRNGLGEHVYLRTGLPSALVSLLLYGPPVFLMSMISPCLIRLQTAGQQSQAGDAGLESGFFMSLSTIGSIAGTMLSSYLLIPFYGVVASAVSTSAIFFLLCAAGWWLSGAAVSRAWMLRTLAVFGVVGTALTLLGAELGARQHDPALVYHAESHYGELQVYRELDEAGRERLTYHPSRVYTHSMLYPAEPLRDLEGSMYLVPGLLRPPRNVLVLGSAAGGVLRGIERAFPAAHVTGVDLDPKVHEVASQVFGVNPGQSTLVTADARVYLAETDQLYDLIIVDLFSGEFIPPHCISLEFFKLVAERLAPNGGVFVNTNMNDLHYELGPANEPFRAVRHLQATLRAAGFAGLLENSFFHSSFAFREPLPAAQLRRQLLKVMADPTYPTALRAGAGLAAYTTVDVPEQHDQYRPYTDKWTPTFLIELKSNAPELFSALSDSGRLTRVAPGSAADRVSDLVLRQSLSERSGEAALLTLGPLLSSLESLADELGPDAVDTAAKYFRFSPELAREVHAPARSPWARLAESYAELQLRGRANDYEAVLPLLVELTDRLDGGRG